MPPPEVSYIGYATTSSSKVGVIKTSYSSRVIREGETLGDYEVLELNPDSVVFGYETAHRFEIPADMQSGPDGPSPQAGSIFMSFDCDIVDATRALAALTDSNVFLAPDVAQYVEVRPTTASSFQKALEIALASTPYASREESGFTIVGLKPTVDQTAQAIANSRHGGNSVKLNFKNADLVYVIDVLARESSQQLFLDEYVEGSVTIRCDEVPAEDVLALILNSREEPYPFLFSRSTLVVADTYSNLDGIRKYLEDDGGELVSINPEGFDWGDGDGRTYFPMEELMKLFAERAGLRIEGELDPVDIGVSLRFCPSLRALHVVAGLAEHDCLISGERLRLLPTSDFVLLQLIGDPKNAEKYMETVVEQSRKYRGRLNHETGEILYSGYLFYDDRDLTKAVDYLRQALEVYEAEGGNPGHAFTARMYLWKDLDTLNPSDAQAEYDRFVQEWTRRGAAGEVTMEMILEVAPPRAVALYLMDEFPSISFTPSTRNGFWARGPKDDVLQVKRDLILLDRMPAR